MMLIATRARSGNRVSRITKETLTFPFGRTAVILERENYDVWLDLGFRKLEPLLDLLLPYRADSMRQYRVSTRVNSVQNDDPACAEEYSPQMYLEKLNRRASEMAQSTDEQIGTVTVR